MSFRAKLVATILTAVLGAALAGLALVASLAPGTLPVTVLVLAFAATGIAGAALAWTLSTPLAREFADVSYRAAAISALGTDVPGRLRNLEADRARLAAILGGMIEGVLVVNEHGRLQLANDAARRMLRMGDAVEGRHYPEIVRHPAVAGQIAAVLAGGASEPVELTAAHDPSITFLARTAAVNAPNGRGAVVVLHDITDLRRADRIRRDFVANVSHELRTPLTAIRGYVEALSDASVEESRRFLTIVARHTQRMEGLVRDLLRLARLDARQEVVERTPFEIETLVRAAETDLARVLADRGHRIRTDIGADAAIVQVDPSKMQDVLRNLIENAANYAPKGSTIGIRTRRNGRRVAIVVEDEGPGIPVDDVSRIFERFYRADKARVRSERESGGTGLGLAIVKHLVELHGGTITAGNRPEGGAVFTIELPD